MKTDNRRAPFGTDEFPWVSQPTLNGIHHDVDDDFICTIGDYTLRVVQMYKGHWLWRVYYKGKALPEQTKEFASSKYTAIGRCEGMYMGHSIKQINYERWLAFRFRDGEVR